MTHIAEQSLGGLRWLVVAGPRLDAFRALGELARGEIHAVLEGMPERAALERFAATAGGRAALDRVRAATAAAQPTEYAELQALAGGAGVGAHAILLANLRGDLGAGDGTGCSDLGWRRARSIAAHNEDGAPALQGRFMLLTLALDGAVSLTTQWYAGFLPGNTFTVNGQGLAWGIDHVGVRDPAAAAGRHFVARGLGQARTLDEAIQYLSSHPSAGGFTYNFGEVATGRVATVEAAAGRVAVVEADPAARPLLWHTNHLRHLDAGPQDAGAVAHSLGPSSESVARGGRLDALAVPEDEPDAGWFLDVLGSPGVHRSAEHGDPLMTLCASAADLTAGEVTLQPRGGPRVTLPLADLAAGRYSAGGGPTSSIP